MPGYSEVCVWFPDLKLTALKKALAAENTRVEDRLLEKLEEIYCKVVPIHMQAAITADLEAIARQEQEETARREAERYRESVIKVCAGGDIRCWKICADISDLHLARALRTALRSRSGDTAAAFETLLEGKTRIDQEEFVCVAGQYLREEKPAANAVKVDFDNGFVILTKPHVGSYVYRMKDVSTAIFRAEQSKGISEKMLTERFCHRLADKEWEFIPMKDCDAPMTEVQA